MPRDLLIAAGPGEWRAILREDGEPVSLLVERGDHAPAGSIHRGRVVGLVPALDAALVEIGDERPGFLPLRDALPAGAALTEGAAITVRVRREAQGGKAARLTMRRAELPDTAASAAPPLLRLHPAPGFAAALALRLPAAPEAVTADDPAVLAELRTAFPQVALCHVPVADWPLDPEALFDAALAPTIALSGGGMLHIETTHAATLIDVDGGTPERGTPAATALAVNLAAAAAIARQLRLREIAGGVVIDFVGIEGRAPREQIVAALDTALAGDPAQPRLLGWTRLGHVELVRPRRLRSLAETMLEPGGTARSAATVAFAALRALAAAARHQPAANWRLTVAPPVAAALAQPAQGGLRQLEARLARRIIIATDPAQPREWFEIAAI